MKPLLVLGLAALLASCAEPQQQARTGVVGPDGQIIWDQPYVPNVGSSSTTLDDLKDSVDDLKDQQRDAARQAEWDASETRLHQDMNSEEAEKNAERRAEIGQ
jgi:hypothetical protein